MDLPLSHFSALHTPMLNHSTLVIICYFPFPIRPLLVKLHHNKHVFSTIMMCHILYHIGAVIAVQHTDVSYSVPSLLICHILYYICAVIAVHDTEMSYSVPYLRSNRCTTYWYVIFCTICTDMSYSVPSLLICHILYHICAVVAVHDTEMSYSVPYLRCNRCTLYWYVIFCTIFALLLLYNILICHILYHLYWYVIFCTISTDMSYSVPSLLICHILYHICAVIAVHDTFT